MAEVIVTCLSNSAAEKLNVQNDYASLGAKKLDAYSAAQKLDDNSGEAADDACNVTVHMLGGYTEIKVESFRAAVELISSFKDYPKSPTYPLAIRRDGMTMGLSCISPS